MPHRVDRWNFTDRGSASVYNDMYRGKGNATYTASSMRQNQGFASVKATFPQGAFMTCRYPDTPELQRTPEQNTWHPQHVQAASVENRYAAASAAAKGESLSPPVVRHNTTGTKPLPIPFSQRPGYEQEQAAIAAEKRRAYEAFKAHQISTVGGDKIPDDFYEHTQRSEEHERTELKPGQIFRPSKPRVGTTPLERAQASRAQEAAQEELARSAAQQEQASVAAQRRAIVQQQAREERDRYMPAAYDPQRGTYYNIPRRA